MRDNTYRSWGRHQRSFAESHTLIRSTTGPSAASSSSSSQASLLSAAAPPRKPGRISRTGLRSSAAPSTTSPRTSSLISPTWHGTPSPGPSSLLSSFILTLVLMPPLQSHRAFYHALRVPRAGQRAPLLHAHQLGRPPVRQRAVRASARLGDRHGVLRRLYVARGHGQVR
jgi:hypothetical protein